VRVHKRPKRVKKPVKKEPKRKRIANDNYQTPLALVQSFFDAFPLQTAPEKFLEPGCGDHAPFAQVVKTRWPSCEVRGVDVREVSPPKGLFDVCDTCTDFLKWAPPEFKFDVVATNPPYSSEILLPFVRKCLAVTKDDGVVLLLLRAAWMESDSRRKFHEEEIFPRHMAFVSKRPSFTGDGKVDSTLYAFFTYDKAWDRPHGETFHLLSPPLDKPRWM
jgi:hypothetical protein